MEYQLKILVQGNISSEPNIYYPPETIKTHTIIIRIPEEIKLMFVKDINILPEIADSIIKEIEHDLKNPQIRKEIKQKIINQIIKQKAIIDNSNNNII